MVDVGVARLRLLLLFVHLNLFGFRTSLDGGGLFALVFTGLTSGKRVSVCRAFFPPLAGGGKRRPTPLPSSSVNAIVIGVNGPGSNDDGTVRSVSDVFPMGAACSCALNLLVVGSWLPLLVAGGLFRTPLYISRSKGLIFKIQTAFDSANVIYIYKKKLKNINRGVSGAEKEQILATFSTAYHSQVSEPILTQLLLIGSE